MKTPKEIKEFLYDKTFNQEDTRTIKAIIKSKNYEGINVINGGIPNCKLIEFIEWFENKPKEGNQDTITFKGKEYEFIESTWGDFCINCDLREFDNCTLFPRICCSEYRRDMREGYFKLIKQKNLELIGGEFYKDVYKGATAVISIIDKQTKWDNDYVHTTHSLIIDFKKNHILTCSGRITIDYFKKHYSLATPEEKQLLIDKIEKETDKVWNEKTKSIEDKPKDILVPENIKIGRYNGKLLSLFFNENKQYLMFSLNQQTYIVQSADGYEKAFKCKLIPFKYEEIEAGDIFFVGELTMIDELSSYCIKISEYKYAAPQDGGDIFVNDIEPYDNVYKVVPINN